MCHLVREPTRAHRLLHSLPVVAPLCKAVDEALRHRETLDKLSEGKGVQKGLRDELIRLSAIRRLSPSVLHCTEHADIEIGISDIGEPSSGSAAHQDMHMHMHIAHQDRGAGAQTTTAVQEARAHASSRYGEVERALSASAPALKSSRKEVKALLSSEIGKVAFLRRLQVRLAGGSQGS